MTRREKRRFIRTVRAYYAHSGRHTLPWRRTTNPYRILVSEIMLQQTQVDRVIPKYRAFLAQFPTIATLAHASLGDVLRAWQGLGYNRRAKMLHACAQTVVAEYGGRIPREESVLRSLPGIGAYTAAAVRAFAYNSATPLIETNVRSVFVHHFFHDRTDVSDAEIMVYVTETLDTKEPRQWYWALMDYGAYIKKAFGNPNSRTTQYTRQSSFRGSDRQIRGAVIRALSHTRMSRAQLHTALPFEMDRIDAQIERLCEEGMVIKSRGSYGLPD